MLLILPNSPLPAQFDENVELYLPQQEFTRAAKMPCRFEVVEGDGLVRLGREGDYVVLDENDAPRRVYAADFEAKFTRV